MIPHKPKGTLWESSGCGYRELGGPLWLHSDLLCHLGQARFPFCLPSAKCGYRRLLPTGLTEVLRKKPCLLGKYHFPGARSCENLCRSSQSVKGRLSFQSESATECPCPSARAERKGCLSCREVVGTDGLWQNKREVPIKGGRAPQLERRADGSEAVRRGTSQFTQCCDSELVAFREPEGPPTSFPFFEEGL